MEVRASTPPEAKHWREHYHGCPAAVDACAARQRLDLAEANSCAHAAQAGTVSSGLGGLGWSRIAVGTGMDPAS
jgi:hypothetical protein